MPDLDRGTLRKIRDYLSEYLAKSEGQSYCSDLKALISSLNQYLNERFYGAPDEFVVSAYTVVAINKLLKDGKIRLASNIKEYEVYHEVSEFVKDLFCQCKDDQVLGKFDTILEGSYSRFIDE